MRPGITPLGHEKMMKESQECQTTIHSSYISNLKSLRTIYQHGFRPDLLPSQSQGIVDKYG